MKTTFIFAGLMALATAAFAQSNGSSQTQPTTLGQTVQPQQQQPTDMPTDPNMQRNPADPSQNRPGQVSPTNPQNPTDPRPQDGSGQYGSMNRRNSSGQTQKNPNDRTRRKNMPRQTGKPQRADSAMRGMQAEQE